MRTVIILAALLIAGAGEANASKCVEGRTDWAGFRVPCPGKYYGGILPLREAARWFRLAAEQGRAEAQFNLGIFHSKGWGVPQDYKEAFRWYRLAAEQGHAAAQFNLGLMYTKGDGVPQDYVHAHMWLNLAASRGSQEAAKARADIANRMTAEQIAEAQRLAREWLPKN